ncbi:aminotransferase class I/II-fold pyridoxal phosphate-dependent enzyme [Paraburkholderia acidisoli]|uniref:Aminotransferase class I/II-fold pyridoxal phosphate-dependent enzyme n=1 Tax=Paraburkholderia acidisoli TaxID=2571748 RepID=A0A7Z2GKC7_9BURK|nr:aminotransferase class I/II-fold pyridoxal phosphate-dependent enzyme [Paraburkholderia acidisoli]QGZ63328.1 aminotransferase class I/II-fold pyridoxal phosphate-dependent enzyme [Paraburkholderia acidisoli]
MSDVKDTKAQIPSTAASVKTDSFGNPVDPTVGFARGSIIRSSIDEALRLRHGQAVAAKRVKLLGAASIGVFTGNQRDFPIHADDIATLCEEWVGPGLAAEELRQVAIGHMGGRGDDAVAIFNRTSAGIVATIAALADGKPIVSVVPPKGRSHASVIRGAKLAGVAVHEVQGNNEWLKVVEAQRPALVVVTTVTSSLERLEDHVTLEVVQFAHALGAKVFLDEAYGARLRTVLHGGRLSLQLGADIAVTNCDKAGLSGPRAGVLVGRADLVTAAAARGAEYGMEARAPISAAVLRSLQKYQPEDLREESAAGQKLAEALAQKLGAGLVQRSDLGPMVEEDAVLRVLLKLAGRENEKPVVVPCEATSALGMVLLEDHGILTVNTHGQPGARVSLRLKPTLDALGRTGGFDAVVAAVMKSLEKVASIIHDRDAVAQLVIGK